jgi:hypothetical protein
VRLHLDAARIEADERVRERACNHAHSVRSESARPCADFVPRDYAERELVQLDRVDPRPRS